ncbi:MAG: hypothetical protein K0Q72_1456 [Armatimonadetes bacterium]|jgi:hypothetical protein|nr:hypothetical protein [Armatimonadota bacterium]
MHQDTRRLTVAYDHLRSAYDEINQAIGQSEQSMAEAAASRALTHLDLVWRRLEHERQHETRGAAGVEVERAYNASRMAWQGVHDVLNDWRRKHAATLDQVRTDILEAMDAAGRICEPTRSGPVPTPSE